MDKLDLLEKAGFVLWSNEDYATGIVDWGSNYDKEILYLIDLVIEECRKNEF